MFSESVIVKKFDAFVKKCLSNELKDYMDEKKVRGEHSVIFSDLKAIELEQLYSEDIYSFENFQEVLKTVEFDAVIQDELLYEYLSQLAPLIREIVVLKYWGDYTDKEISKILKLSLRQVNYNKNKALNILKDRIEELQKNDIRFKL